MAQHSNLHKSEAGWRRLRERTNSGAFARGSMMDHSVQSAKPKADVVIPEYEGSREKPKRRSCRKRRVVAPNGRTF